MRKKQKGMSVIEVVVSFALISLSLAMGMAGIACGAHFMNSGAKLKNVDRKTVVRDIKSAASSNATITVTDANGTAFTVTVTEQQMNGFKWYSAGGGSP